MSRRSDRKKQGKENPASHKDESDAATLRSSDIDVGLRSTTQSVRSDMLLLQSRENVTPLQLLSESVGSETKRPDCKTNIVEMLMSLEAKINVMLEKSRLEDSSDKDSFELQGEMQKLLQATMKQKDDFSQLHDTVRRQREMLQRLEMMAKTGNISRPITSAIESREVAAIQCCQDLESRPDLDSTIVFLISGRYEYRRRLSQSSDELINVYIPDSVNLGSRMLPGRQSFPNALLQSLTFDATPKSPSTPTALMPLLSGRGPGLGAVAGANERVGSVMSCPVMSCPVCALEFPMTETLDAFELHVDSHFTEH